MECCKLDWFQWGQGCCFEVSSWDCPSSLLHKWQGDTCCWTAPWPQSPPFLWSIVVCPHPPYFIQGLHYEMLSLTWRTFSSSVSVSVRKLLYLCLIGSRLLYCSVVWRPCLWKDIALLERVQRRATKFILDDFHSNYKTCLHSLGLLLLLMVLELNNIVFLLKSLQPPSESFNILDFVRFSTSSTHSASKLKLRHSFSTRNSSSLFYFNRLPHLWNRLPVVDSKLSHLVFHKLNNFFGYTSPQISTRLIHVHRFRMSLPQMSVNILQL